MRSLQKRIEKAEKMVIKNDYDPVVFLGRGQRLENFKIGPKTVVIVDDLEN